MHDSLARFTLDLRTNRRSLPRRAGRCNGDFPLSPSTSGGEAVRSLSNGRVIAPIRDASVISARTGYAVSVSRSASLEFRRPILREVVDETHDSLRRPRMPSLTPGTSTPAHPGQTGSVLGEILRAARISQFTKLRQSASALQSVPRHYRSCLKRDFGDIRKGPGVWRGE